MILNWSGPANEIVEANLDEMNALRGELVPTEKPTGQATAKKALGILQARGFIPASRRARRNLAMAYAARGKIVYGQAFDAIRVDSAAKPDFSKLSQVEEALDMVTLYEVKATNRDLPDDFSGYFFSMSTAELLVAQSLGPAFRFALVNTQSDAVLDLTLSELLGRAKAIYPTWSISI